MIFNNTISIYQKVFHQTDEVMYYLGKYKILFVFEPIIHFMVFDSFVLSNL